MFREVINAAEMHLEQIYKCLRLYLYCIDSLSKNTDAQYLNIYKLISELKNFEFENPMQNTLMITQPTCIKSHQSFL